MLEKIITFNASPKLHAAIERRAKALGIKKSRLLREAVIHGLLPAEKAIKEEEGRVPE